MRVEQVFRYPAKSMLGQSLGSIDIDALGVRGDRQWAVRDLERGAIVGAKKIGELMGLAAFPSDRATDAGIAHIEIVFPDGSRGGSDDADIDARLSAALGRPVALQPLASNQDHYRRAAPDHADVEVELRSIFGLEQDEPLPDMSVFPETVIEFESPPGTYYDVFPIVINSTGSMASLQSMLPDSLLDWRRFRPSIVLDLPTTDEEPWPERALCGRQIRVGSAVLDVLDPTPRCVMVTRGFADVPADRGVMRTLVREASHSFGVYATVVTPGRVAVGDELTIV